MEGPLSPGATNGTSRASSPTPPTVDPQMIIEYLEKVLDANLGATERDLRASGSFLSDDKRNDTLQRCLQFSKENQSVLYITKERSVEASVDGMDGTNGECLKG
jgi:dynein heavy chain 1